MLDGECFSKREEPELVAGKRVGQSYVPHGGEHSGYIIGISEMSAVHQ